MQGVQSFTLFGGLIRCNVRRLGPGQGAFEPLGSTFGRNTFRVPVEQGEIEIASDQLAVLVRQALRHSIVTAAKRVAAAWFSLP